MDKFSISSVDIYFLFGILLISSVLSTASPSSASQESPTDKTLINSICTGVDDLLSTLQNEGKNLAVLASDERLIIDLQKFIVDRLKDGTRISENFAPSLSQNSSPSTKEPSVLHVEVDKEALYLRLGRLDNDTLMELKQFLESYKDKSPLLSIILDLRYSQDFNWDLIDLFESVLASTIDAPIILLVNSFTIGAFEILANRLQKNGKGLVVGEITGGEGFEYKQVELKNDMTLWIPKNHYLSKTEKGKVSEPCNPNVHFPNKLSYNDLLSKFIEIESLKSDNGVKKGLELAKAYKLFGKKRF